MSRPLTADWYKAYMTIPDVQPRAGVVRPASFTLQQLQGGTSEDGGPSPDQIIQSVLSSPGTRPEVYLRATSFALTAGITTTAITQNRLSVDAIIVDTPSAAANSVFFGYGSGISTASGLEVRAGIPLIWQGDNTREEWELQRQLEYIALLLAVQSGVATLAPYKAPRVVVDPSQYFVVAAAPTNISITLVYVPEQQ